MLQKRILRIVWCLGIFFSGAIGATLTPETLIEQADAFFAQDYIEDSLRQSIALYEQALELEPYNSYILNRLSEAYYKLGYVYLFVLAEDPQVVEKERIDSYEKGLAYGMRSLELNPLFRANKDENFRQALQAVDDVIALHWLSCNWGKVLEVSFIRALLELAHLKATLERALEVDRTYVYGGPLRAMASYWANLPWWWGQDLEQAKVLFEESINLFPDFLGNRALYIQEYIARIKNCQLLQEQVSFIRQSPIHEDYRIWDIASKVGIEKFLETVSWCSVGKGERPLRDTLGGL